MSDLIDRKQAIDAIDEHEFAMYCPKDEVTTVLNDLPSTQPDLILCKDCRHDNNCAIQYAAQAGNTFFCGAAERREDEQNT